MKELVYHDKPYGERFTYFVDSEGNVVERLLTSEEREAIRRERDAAWVAWRGKRRWIQLSFADHNSVQNR